eukprot:TRINITY_DN1648_c0_g1_i5.p1 TRINITY_DN1648_c0_g1~~TRINITY_DN1648_c0_g1_i5.p1  ORF type:complete len:455 (+),score=177.81 TRINITY_DN1648_c0_g1_i5:50-1366(+)
MYATQNSDVPESKDNMHEYIQATLPFQLLTKYYSANIELLVVQPFVTTELDQIDFFWGLVGASCQAIILVHDPMDPDSFHHISAWEGFVQMNVPSVRLCVTNFKSDKDAAGINLSHVENWCSAMGFDLGFELVDFDHPFFASSTEGDDDYEGINGMKEKVGAERCIEALECCVDWPDMDYQTTLRPATQDLTQDITQQDHQDTQHIGSSSSSSSTSTSSSSSSSADVQIESEAADNDDATETEYVPPTVPSKTTSSSSSSSSDSSSTTEKENESADTSQESQSQEEPSLSDVDKQKEDILSKLPLMTTEEILDAADKEAQAEQLLNQKLMSAVSNKDNADASEQSEQSGDKPKPRQMPSSEIQIESLLNTLFTGGEEGTEEDLENFEAAMLAMMQVKKEVQLLPDEERRQRAAQVAFAFAKQLGLDDEEDLLSDLQNE